MKNNLVEYRKQIDIIDGEIIKLLGERMGIVKKVGIHKKKENVPPLDSKRWNEVLNAMIKQGAHHGLSKKLITDIYEAIHAEALQIEKTI